MLQLVVILIASLSYISDAVNYRVIVRMEVNVAAVAAFATEIVLLSILVASVEMVLSPSSRYIERIAFICSQCP